MKYLLSIVAVMFLIGCNPYGVLDEVTKGGVTNKLVDVITTDVIIQTIDENGIQETVHCVPTLPLDRFLDDIGSWAYVFKSGSGYALKCAYLEVKRLPNNKIDIYLLAAPINSMDFEAYWWQFAITDEDWSEVKTWLPKNIVRNTDVYITIK
jgi:hypothetical protein